MDPLRPHDPERIGSYRLRSRLGAGGMGEVFLAASPGGREVVVKVIRPELAGTASARRRFAREIAAAQRVGGFHTAQVVDAAPHAEPPWMVTEYIPGPSLQRLVRDAGPLSPENVRALAAQLAEGLSAIHACGLVHRDLKPGNVIMAGDGARIIDFGVARMEDASVLTESGGVVGTYAFMSPEQVNAGGVGPSSDVFSLGSVLAWAATGHSPFAAATIPAIVLRIVNAEPDLGGIPGDLRGVISACLAKDPAGRPTAPDVLGWLSGSDGAAFVPPPPAPSPPSRTEPSAGGSGTARPTPVPRRRFLLAGLAGVTAVAVPAVVVAVRDSGAEARPRTPAPTPTMTIHEGVLANGHGAVVTDVAFTAKGDVLASGGADGPVLLWNVTTGARIRALEGHAYPLVAMIFSADGRTLTTGAEGVMTWDAATGRRTGTISTAGRSEHPVPIVAMALSPDGKYLATDASGGDAMLWDAATGGRVRTFTGDAGASLAFTPDGRALAGGGGSVRLWDVNTGATIRTFAGIKGRAHSVAVSPDGRILAGSSDTGPALLWDLATGRRIRELSGMGNSSGPMAFSPDSGFLATAPASDATMAGEISLWDVRTGEVARTLTGHSGDVNALAFHPGGKALASAGRDRTVRLWNLA
ncbi:serine/threonine-protein kinase [Actinomadura sp. KC345]|uniref:WD40 repeat domain-containing serine/threonine protein kinase n=1 Tax=Actinomadura sp. KC345 TaxID=2530371 RepID=UPI0014043F01|nr:serine/threonine-protein kinase [Actinomadura sp. KC345]